MFPSAQVSVCDFSGFVAPFFLKLSTRIFRLHTLIEEENQLVYEGDRVPRLCSSLIGLENIFMANQGDEFSHFWNWFGKNKFPGVLPRLK